MHDIVKDANIHRTHLHTGTALVAFLAVPLDLEERKARGGFEKHRDGTDVLAEGAVVFEDEGHGYADQIVKRVADDHPVQPSHTAEIDVILIIKSKP